MNDTKVRILAAGAELFRRNGYTGTGLKQIATTAGAPFGSIYHFFPGGKQHLGDDVIRSSGEAYADLVFSTLEGHEDIVEGIAVAFSLAADSLVATDYADACPIATIALEVASTNETLREATSDVFTDWIERGTRHMRAKGLSEANARRLTLGLITSLEGAFVLARSMRTTEPLSAASETVQTLAQSMIAK